MFELEYARDSNFVGNIKRERRINPSKEEVKKGGKERGKMQFIEMVCKLNSTIVLDFSQCIIYNEFNNVFVYETVLDADACIESR